MNHDSNDVLLMNGKTMQWVYRTIPLVSSLAVAAASFALSFVALRDVAASTEAVPRYLAWLVPIVIDGGVMCASAVIWASASMGQRRQKFPFFIVFALVAISVVVNSAHAGPSVLAKVSAALPPLVLLATLELVAITTRQASLARNASVNAHSPARAASHVERADRPDAQRRTTAPSATQSTPTHADPIPDDALAVEIEALEAELDGSYTAHIVDAPIDTTPTTSTTTASRRSIRVRSIPPEK